MEMVEKCFMAQANQQQQMCQFMQACLPQLQPRTMPQRPQQQAHNYNNNNNNNSAPQCPYVPTVKKVAIHQNVVML